MNQLHPFYLVYVSESGDIVSNYMNVRKTLDILKKICKCETAPIYEAYRMFNELTN